MFGVRRSTTTGLLAALVLACGALPLAGVSISGATDPAVGACAPAADAAQSDPSAADAAVATGPTGPADSACAQDAPADVSTTTDAPPAPDAEPPATADAPPAASPATGGEATPQAPAATAPADGGSSADQAPRAPQASSDSPKADPAPADPAAATSPARHQPSITVQAPRVVRHHRASRTLTSPRRPHSQHHITEADVYFPPVFVDWAALTPLAPPEFGAAEATRFPGPLFLLPIYQAAAVQYDVPWQILASINEIETNFGTNRHRSSAGAVGWMQFLPSTWRTYGVDANGDGIANPEDPVDAIFAAARYLHASGSVQDLGRALFSYNHANWYVARVLQRAVEIGSIPQDLLTSLTTAGRKDAGALRRATGATGYLAAHAEPDTIGRVMLLDDDALAAATLADDRAQIYSCGRDDIRAGIIDRRVLETIEYLAFRGLEPSVTSLRCGHGFHTRSGSISEHSYGAALDVARVNGIPILGHQGAGTITDSAIQQLLKLGGASRPHQIISLMTFTGAPNTLALGDHDDHIHIGFAPVRPLEGS